MSESLTVYRPGDRFATMTANGSAYVWEVDTDGVPANASNGSLSQQERDNIIGIINRWTDSKHRGDNVLAIEFAINDLRKAIED